MPTYAWLARFRADFERLTPAQRATFLLAVGHFVEDLGSGRPFRKGLRVKGIQGATGIFEMTSTDDGRATFEYGDEVIKGEAHVIWRRVGMILVDQWGRGMGASAPSPAQHLGT